MMRCLNCAFHSTHIVLAMYHISPYTLLLHTHRSYAEWFVHYVTIWSNCVCVPQMCIRRTGNDSFMLVLNSCLNDFVGVSMYCVHSMLCRWAVRTHISFFHSLVRSSVYLYTLPTQYMLIALILDREVAAKSSSKSDSVVLSIGSVAFFWHWCVVYFWFVHLFSVICVRINR